MTSCCVLVLVFFLGQINKVFGFCQQPVVEVTGCHSYHCSGNTLTLSSQCIGDNRGNARKRVVVFAQFGECSTHFRVQLHCNDRAYACTHAYFEVRTGSNATVGRSSVDVAIDCGVYYGCFDSILNVSSTVPMAVFGDVSVECTDTGSCNEAQVAIANATGEALLVCGSEGSEALIACQYLGASVSQCEAVAVHCVADYACLKATLRFADIGNVTLKASAASHRAHAAYYPLMFASVFIGPRVAQSSVHCRGFHVCRHSRIDARENGDAPLHVHCHGADACALDSFWWKAFQSDLLCPRLLATANGPNAACVIHTDKCTCNLRNATIVVSAQRGLGAKDVAIVANDAEADCGKAASGQQSATGVFIASQTADATEAVDICSFHFEDSEWKCRKCAAQLEACSYYQMHLGKAFDDSHEGSFQPDFTPTPTAGSGGPKHGRGFRFLPLVYFFCLFGPSAVALVCVCVIKAHKRKRKDVYKQMAANSVASRREADCESMEGRVEGSERLQAEGQMADGMPAAVEMAEVRSEQSAEWSPANAPVAFDF